MGFTLFNAFTRQQKKDIAIYAAGIMCYKFGLEYFNGAFITLANERFPKEVRYRNVGVLTGTNAAMQCVGSILIAPLMKRFPTRTVLSYAVLVFGLISMTLLIADAATGGKPKNMNGGKTKYGSWSPNGLFPIYIISGVAYGMVELIRRVIPRNIVAGDVQRLRRMDAIVHILYEVAGTTGAFTSTALIQKFGYNYSCFMSPVLFSMAALIWRFVSNTEAEMTEGEASRLEQMEREDKERAQGRNYLHSIWVGFRSFGKATYFGAMLVMTRRRYAWLVVGYSAALYGHRYLENGLGPIFAKQVLGTSAWSQIITGGSNFGELLGALSVLLLTNYVPTPIPFLRIDALALNLVWVLPFIAATKGDVMGAWKVAACFIPISFGWAAGDVSLAAYIQSTLAKLENIDPDVSALGAVMAFLYVTYIVLYAVLSAVLGRWVDKQLTAGTSAREVLKYVGGVQFSLLCVLVLAASCIPRGAISFNPQLIEGHNSVESDGEAEEETGENYELGKDGDKVKTGTAVDGKDLYVNGAQVPVVEKN